MGRGKKPFECLSGFFGPELPLAWPGSALNAGDSKEKPAGEGRGLGPAARAVDADNRLGMVRCFRASCPSWSPGPPASLRQFWGFRALDLRPHTGTELSCSYRGGAGGPPALSGGSDACEKQQKRRMVRCGQSTPEWMPDRQEAAAPRKPPRQPHTCPRLPACLPACMHACLPQRSPGTKGCGLWKSEPKGG